MILRFLVLVVILVVSFLVCVLFVLIGSMINPDDTTRKYDLDAMTEEWRDNTFVRNLWTSLNS